jgi:hypothetical protein
MVKSAPANIIILFLLLLTNDFLAQGVFSTVSANKNEVYVGEPVQITVSVFTPTWFTKGVDIGNIKVNGAFSVYFRSLSTSRKINGQTYAGVQLFYNVFPFEEQDIVIPALSFEVETPAVGGYKGIRRKVQTKETVIRNKPIPPDIDPGQWFVSGGMTVRENWKGNLNSVKVGDVLERTITRNANNTVAELIPPVIWDSIASVSLYPIRPIVNTNKGKLAISATRTDGVKYLFEEEGDIILPDIEFSWWNPSQNKYLKRTIKGRTISVKPNPDLGILRTIKDSLAVKQEVLNAEEDEKEAKTYFGLPLKQFLILLAVLCIVVYLLIRYLLKARKVLIRKREEYRASESYAFRRFLSVANSEEPGKTISALYGWIGHLGLKEPTLRELAIACDSKELMFEIETIEGVLIDKNKGRLPINKKLWQRSRNKLIKIEQEVPSVTDWINP